MATIAQPADDKPIGARAAAIEILVAVLAVVAFYAVHLDFSRMQTGGDFANLFWPLKEFRVRVVGETGTLPLWNPYVFMGSPLAATMQHAIFYPLDWLFFWRSPTFAAMNLYILAHSAIAGIGMWRWMRCGWRASGAASVFAGAVFPCTAWFWGAQEHINQVATVAWMPWLLCEALLFARGAASTARFVAAYAALSAVQFLAGHPQAAFYTHLAAGAMLLAVVVLRARPFARMVAALNGRSPFASVAAGPASILGAVHRPSAMRLLGGFVAAGMLAGLASAVQLLPTLELGRLSYRQFQHADAAYSMTYSMPPDALKMFVAPHAFGSYVDGYADQRAYNEYGVFVGISTLALAALGLARLVAARRNGLALLGLGAVTLTLLLALGGNTSIPRIAAGEFTEFPQPALGGAETMQDVHVAGENAFRGVGAISLHEIFVAVVPPAAGFRVPARIVVLTAFLLVTLAGFGVEALCRARVPVPPAVLAVLVGAVAFADLYLPSTKEKFRHPKDIAPLLLEVAQDADLRPRATIDDRLYRLTTGDLDLIVSERQRSAEEEWELRLGGNGPSQRWVRWQENDNVVALLPSVEGYEEGLSPTVRTKDFVFEINRNLRSFQPDEQLFALLGVGRVFADLPLDPQAFPAVPGESRAGRNIQRVPAARGAAFWAEQAEGIDFARLDGPFARGGSPHGRRRDDAIAYGEAKRWNDPQWPRLTTDTTNPNEVVVRADGPVPGDAILSMGCAPGWTVGGEPVAWLGAVHARIPADAFVDGVARLEYRPASFRMGLFLSALGVLALATLAVVARPSALTRRAAP